MFSNFKQLHYESTPLLIGNIWDVQSALVFEQLGFKAIATSSAAVANSFGYQDGETLPFDEIVNLAKKVKQKTSLPLSVDIEGGYSRIAQEVIENIKKLHDIGVVGVNIEDTLPDKKQGLQAIETFASMIEAIKNYLIKSNIEVFLNIRTDGFLLGLPDALKETLLRIKAYDKAGADGIFVPCITVQSDISEVVKTTVLPINVMCMPQLPSFSELENLGVRRISMGNFLHQAVVRYINQTSADIMDSKGFEPLFK
jgi:2-methylisocitrate lyase-like PEP mutase family enzyme